jgi:ParB-like chromosome segregation protein Spo0J
MEPTMSKSPKSPFPKPVVTATLATPNPSNATALPHAPTAPVESVADDVLSMFGDPAKEASQLPAEGTGEAVPEPVAVDEHGILTPADPEVVDFRPEADVAEHVDLPAAQEPETESDHNSEGDARHPRVSTDAASTQMDVDGSRSPGVGAVDLPAHPAADLFPMLGEDELLKLAADIRENGIHEPIVLHEGKVLDGRNRLAACKLAGVEPRFVTWAGSGSPTTWVLSRNLHRRHLTASQRAAVAVDALPLLEAEAKERQRVAGLRSAASRSTHGEVPATLPEPVLGAGEAREKAAAAVGASARYVSDAKAIAEKAPEVLVEVRSGALSIPEGRRIAALPTPEERKEAIKEVKAGTGKREERVPKSVVAPPSGTDTLGPVRAAVVGLGKLLDAVPKADRPIWWAALRKAIRAVVR